MLKKGFDFVSSIKSSFAPGLVVFLVALPLCLGISIASGAPLMAGVISGIVGGIVVGILSGSPISVSGPAAGLTAIILAAVTELGAFELFLCAGIIAGCIQIILGLIKAGSISNYFPNNVIEGMLAGIGVIIILKQLPYAFGFFGGNISSESVFDMGYSIEALGRFTQYVFSQLHFGAIIITVISIAVLIVWERTPRLQAIKLLPAALVAVVVSIALNAAFKAMNSPLYLDEMHRVVLPIVASVSDIGDLFVFPDFSAFLNSKVWIVGVTIAVVASIETLLCVEAADKMDKKKRITNTNRELKAQGIGNIISSFLGGLPMTSVVVRSSANASAGATSKMSSIIHGVLLLISVLSIPFILNLIPLATLAAVLLLVGYKLAKPSIIIHFWHKGKYQFIPFIVTLVAIVLTDLLKGVLVGMVISIAYILLGNMRRAYYISSKDLQENDSIYMTLAEEVSFLNKASIKQTLRGIKAGTKITIDASRSTYIALDVLELIEDFANYRAKEEGIDLLLVGFDDSERQDLGKSSTQVRLRHATML
ncbi:MAG: SulP family inorganic anion transporter [Bacteroidales bacterium]